MKKWKIRPMLSQNAWNDGHQNLRGWLCRGLLPNAKFHHDMITPFRRPNMRKCAPSDSASLRPPDDSRTDLYILTLSFLYSF